MCRLAVHLLLVVVVATASSKGSDPDLSDSCADSDGAPTELRLSPHATTNATALQGQYKAQHEFAVLRNILAPETAALLHRTLSAIPTHRWENRIRRGGMLELEVVGGQLSPHSFAHSTQRLTRRHDGQLSYRPRRSKGG